MRLNLGFGLVGVALAVAIGMPIASSAVGPAAAQTVGPQKAKKSSAKAKDTPDGKSARSPAETDRILDSAAKSISDGNPDAAMTALDGVLAGGNLANKHMARALYLRGVAHRRKGRPAQAIADLTSAIWLKDGLNDADRNAALAARNEVSREVGVADTTAPEGPARAEGARPAVVARAEPAGAPPAAPAASPRVISAPLPVSQAPAPTGLLASPPPSQSADLSEGGFPRAGAPARPAPAVATSPRRAASSSDLTEGGFPRSYAAAPQQPASPQASPPAPSSAPSAAPGGGIGEFFSGFFTGNTPPGSSSQAGPAKKTAEVSAWSTSTDKKAVSKPDRIVTNSTPREPVAAAADGRFRLQIAAVRSRKEAETVAARVKQDYARVIGARKLEVDETVFGNMGTFYRVRLGPFAAADEPKALCDTLRSSGYDCLVVSQ